MNSRNKPADNGNCDYGKAHNPECRTQLFIPYIFAEQHRGASHYYANEHRVRRRKRSLGVGAAGHNDRAVVDYYFFK